MRIDKLKSLSTPKVAVLVTGLVAAVMVATVSPQAAQATPTKTTDCSGCHSAVSGPVTAVPSTSSPAAGAAYTVLVTPPTNSAGGDTGYRITDAAGTIVTTGGYVGTSAATYTAAMTAPASGTATYTVWAVHGPADSTGMANSTTYSITVGSAPTTPPVTSPPVTSPPVTTPPVTTPLVTTPPVTGAQITTLSPDHGAAGTIVTIRGTGFGTSGASTFGTAKMKASSWSDDAVVVTVPALFGAMVSSRSAGLVPVWYRHGDRFSVSVTPEGSAASDVVSFRLDSHNARGGAHDVQSGHLRDAGERD